MNICIDCTKKMKCDNPSEEITECKEFKEISYETKLVKVDGLNYKFERIDE